MDDSVLQEKEMEAQSLIAELIDKSDVELSDVRIYNRIYPQLSVNSLDDLVRAFELIHNTQEIVDRIKTRKE